MSRVAKWFKLDKSVKEEFERLCRALVLQQSQVLEKILSDWCKEQRDQVRIDVYIPSSGNIIINQPRQVNIAVKAELTYVKLELARILDVLKTAEANSVPEFLKQLAKLAIKANRVQTLTQDNELAQLLAEAEQRFG
jgi:hypothetical protein